MRLLHSTDLTFHEIFEQDIPQHPYAILSHRWGALADEVSYEDFISGKKTDSTGYAKIKSFCDWAASNGYEWVWVDTCCIDKRSSAELSEAINSMYSWYRQSSVCIAYLQDISSASDKFTEDEWFSRGWTLQELIAPRRVLFLTSRWQSVGWKHEPQVSSAVSMRTGIPTRVLADQVDIKYVSVARRMSWMAQRQTTKVEDMAYCLLGIFDVNMPLLYGEGWKAFQRLQLQIMEQYEDDSIFAWNEQSSGAASSALTGLLAKQPSQFARCGGIVTMENHHDTFAQATRANGRYIECFGGLLHTSLETEDRQPHVLHQLRCAHSANPTMYLDIYVTDNVMLGGKMSPCFIALGRRSKTEAFSRIRAGEFPWSLGTYGTCHAIARLQRRPFRARTSFSVEAIIDRVYSGGRSSQRMLSAPKSGQSDFDPTAASFRLFLSLQTDTQNASDLSPLPHAPPMIRAMNGSSGSGYGTSLAGMTMPTVYGTPMPWPSYLSPHESFSNTSLSAANPLALPPSRRLTPYVSLNRLETSTSGIMNFNDPPMTKSISLADSALRSMRSVKLAIDAESTENELKRSNNPPMTKSASQGDKSISHLQAASALMRMHNDNSPWPEPLFSTQDHPQSFYGYEVPGTLTGDVSTYASLADSTGVGKVMDRSASHT